MLCWSSRGEYSRVTPARVCTTAIPTMTAPQFGATRTGAFGTNLCRAAARLISAGLMVCSSAAVLAQPPQALQTSPFKELPAKRPDQCKLGREWSAARLQATWPAENHVHTAVAMGYMGRQQDVLAGDLAEARNQVARVVHASGLEMNLELVPDYSSPAAAQMINGQRVILFDPRFMAQVADKICPDWGAMSILAHEVGHHLAGHTLRPAAEPWRDELEADQFSGFVLARLGATEVETLSAASNILPEQATPTHPGRKDRIAAILHGWQNAEAMLNAEVDQARHGRGLVPMRQDRYEPAADGARASDLDLVARLILFADPNDYYIARSGRVDSYDGIQRRPVGRKSLPNSPNYAWALATNAARLDVDYGGRVFIRLPSGAVDEVGAVVMITPDRAGAQ